MHQRKAVSVLPLPVGARIRVDSPPAIAGQPSCCGGVGAGKRLAEPVRDRRMESLEYVGPAPHAQAYSMGRASGPAAKEDCRRGPESCRIDCRSLAIERSLQHSTLTMGDSGEGLVDADARIQEQMEEREAERRRRASAQPATDPETGTHYRVAAPRARRARAPGQRHDASRCASSRFRPHSPKSTSGSRPAESLRGRGSV